MVIEENDRFKYMLNERDVEIERLRVQIAACQNCEREKSMLQD